MLKYITRPLALVAMTGAILLTFAIIVLMMSVVIFGQAPVLRGVSCYLGLSQECLLRDLKEERRKIDKLEKRQRELMAQVTEADTILKRLSALDHASSSYVVFFEARDGLRKVTTGHTYASLLDPSTLIGAHCYIQIALNGAGKRQINLGTMSRHMRVSLPSYSQSQLQEAGLNARKLTALQAKCRWPDGARLS